MSYDLIVDAELDSSPQIVKDQSGNPSALVLSNTQVGVGTGDAAFPTDAILNVQSPVDIGAIATICASAEGGNHWTGYAGTRQIFNVQNSQDEFGLNVGGVSRLTIDGTGNITLNIGDSFSIEGLAQLSGSGATSLVVDTSSGQIGYQ